MTLYKLTGPKGEAVHGGTGRWTKGRWRSVRGEVVPCRNGLHLLRVRDIPRWLRAGVLWEAEVEGEVIDHGNKIVSRKARLIRQVAVIDDRTLRLLACDFAEHVLPIFEARHPGDDRPRKAIETARRFANGEATREELRAYAAAFAYAAAADAYAAAAAAYAAAYADAYAAAAAYADAYAAYADAEREWQARRTAEVLGIPWED